MLTAKIMMSFLGVVAIFSNFASFPVHPKTSDSRILVDTADHPNLASLNSCIPCPGGLAWYVATGTGQGLWLWKCQGNSE